MSILIPKFNKFEQCVRVGEYDIILPDPPNLRDIENYGIPTEKQMWKPPARPNRNTMSAAQIKGWEDLMIDKCYELGHWLFINGKIVYMTPAHFMYCGFWPIDIGLPWFRWSNAKFFYLWRDVELDDRSVGLVEITNRRDGKTFRGGFIVYHRSSVTANTQGGLQSKTDNDAKKVFRKAIVNPFKKLPKFLQPTWDGNTNPRSEINFYAPTKRLSDIDEYGIDEALETSIDFRPVNAEAYDGEYLVAYFRDEFGKCLGYGTPVRMYDGSIKEVQDIVDGDLVMGPDSGARLVSGTVVGHDEEMFEIRPKSGMTWRCNADHILSLKVASADRFKSKGLNKGDVLNIMVADYLKLPKSDQKHLVLWRTGYDFPEKQVFLDPYFLGIWLGDGYSRGAQITTVDREILNFFEKYADSLGLDVKNKPTDLITYAAVNRDLESWSNKWSTNPIRSALKHYGLLENKHIPNDFLQNSEDIRLQLLAGIIDSDGYAMRSTAGISGYEITQKNKVLAGNLFDLINGLGFRCAMVSKVAKMKRNDGSVYSCVVYRISIYGDLWRIPCRVARKISKKKEKHKNTRNSMHVGFDVVSVGLGNYYGFALHGKDRLFLLGDGTVTHNTVKADVHEGHEFTKYCFYKGSDIVGKGLYSTTVEEMEKKGGKNAKKLWDESDPEIAATDPLGQTTSNMRRYFKPGYEGMEGRHPVTRQPFIDRFGFDVLGPDGFPVAKKYLEERRQKFETRKDWNGLASEKRKYPFTVEEAFRQDAKDCHFNAEILQSRLSYLESRHYQENPAYVKGDFLWKNGEADTEVVWVPNPDGRFLVWKLPPTELRNSFYKDMHGRRVPGNVDLFGAGSDSYDHKKVEDKARASNMAFYVGRKFDASIDTPNVPPMLRVTRLPWLEYVNRPPRPEDAWEDALKACVFYGCRLFPETNKPGLRNHFENRGYINYLQDRPDWTYTNPNGNHEKSPGMASVVGTIEQYVDLLTTWVEDFAAACVFPRLLRHLLEYEIDNTTKFDCAVGWGYTLICLGVRPRKKTPVADINGIAGVLQPSYSNSGMDDSGITSSAQGFTFTDRDSQQRLQKPGSHGFLPDMSFDVGV